MYEVLENPEMMEYEEISRQFDGKWVLVTNCEMSPGNSLIRGIPRVIADEQAEGVDAGIFRKYDDWELYGMSCSLPLFKFNYMIPTIFVE
jgi:hypothetical protein